MSDRELTNEEIVSVIQVQGWKSKSDQIEDGKRRILNQQNILGFTSLDETLKFLLESLPNSGKYVKERIVRLARIHGCSPRVIASKDDGGSCRTYESSIATELYWLLNELPESERDNALEEAEQRYKELIL